MLHLDKAEVSKDGDLPDGPVRLDLVHALPTGECIDGPVAHLLQSLFQEAHEEGSAANHHRVMTGVGRPHIRHKVCEPVGAPLQLILRRKLLEGEELLDVLFVFGRGLDHASGDLLGGCCVLSEVDNHSIVLSILVWSFDSLEFVYIVLKVITQDAYHAQRAYSSNSLLEADIAISDVGFHAVFTHGFYVTCRIVLHATFHI